MDLREIRIGLAAVARAAGFNAWDYMPDDPQDLPASTVGGIESMVRLNEAVTQVQLKVSFYVNETDMQDATARLDKALSVGLNGSFIDTVDEVTTADGPPWRSIRFVSAGPYQRFAMPGNGWALGVETIWEMTA